MIPSRSTRPSSTSPDSPPNGPQRTAARDQQPAPGRQRNTRQATAIEAALADANGFRTAYDLFAQIRHAGQRIGLSTIYRHLALLADTDRADIVHSTDGQTLYRLCGPREATGPAGHHHHIVCRLWGRSVQVAAAEIEAWAQRIAAEFGSSDITHTIELFGVCPQHHEQQPPARQAGADDGPTKTTRPPPGTTELAGSLCHPGARRS